jgi:hypothetical protein
MVNEHEVNLIKTLWIPYELDNIRYYALEIGDFKKMLEGKMASAHDNIRQLYRYFLTYAEIELEAANERITEYRKELDDYDQQRGELPPV